MEPKTSHEYIEQLEGTVKNLSRLIEVNSVLNTTLLSANARVDALLSYLMNAAAEITDSEAASVLLWNKNDQQLFFAATTTGPGQSNELIGKPVPLDSIAGTIFIEKRLIQVDDTRKDPRHYDKVDEDIKFVTRSLLGVPMIAKNNVIGVLEVVNKRKLPWTMEDRNNLSMLANEAAVAINVAQLVNELKRVNDELSELDKLKSDFIAIASHELRTPLGIILGYASFLEEAEDEDTRGHASKVMASALQLRRIIDDMINLRYLKQKPSDLNRELTSLNSIIDDVRRDVRTLASASNHKLEIVCNHGERQVSVDRSRISMALMNILNNAISFTPDGGTIRIEADVPNTREARICIIDTGIGIEENQLEKIFEEFYQIEDHMVRRHGGLGIGLSISRALVQAHGGRVWASSPGLNQGSTFTVSLPLAQSEN